MIICDETQQGIEKQSILTIKAPVMKNKWNRSYTDRVEWPANRSGRQDGGVRSTYWENTFHVMGFYSQNTLKTSESQSRTSTNGTKTKIHDKPSQNNNNMIRNRGRNSYQSVEWNEEMTGLKQNVVSC